MRYRIRGQSLVEFALVVPLLIVIVMGIIDFGYYIYTYSELENATRRASEFAAKSAPINADCIARTKTEARKSIFLAQLQDSQMTVDVSSPRQVGGTTTVKIVNYPVQFLTPVGRSFFKNAKFNFTSKRTILSITPILDANNNLVTCS